MKAKQTKSTQQHVNEWLQWGYNTLVKYPLEIAIGSSVIFYIFNSKAATKVKNTKANANHKKPDIDAKTQEAIKRLEELLSKKDSSPKSNNNDNDGSPMPFTGSSRSGMLLAGGRNANAELEKLAATASEADDEREAADIAPAATINHDTLTITLEGETIVILLAELHTVLADNSPLQPLLATAQTLDLLQINTDGEITEIAKLDAPEEDEDHSTSDKESDGSKEEDMGAPQPSHHVDGETAVSGASAPASEEVE